MRLFSQVTQRTGSTAVKSTFYINSNGSLGHQWWMDVLEKKKNLSSCIFVPWKLLLLLLVAVFLLLLIDLVHFRLQCSIMLQCCICLVAVWLLRRRDCAIKWLCISNASMLSVVWIGCWVVATVKGPMMFTVLGLMLLLRRYAVVTVDWICIFLVVVLLLLWSDCGGWQGLRHKGSKFPRQKKSSQSWTVRQSLLDLVRLYTNASLGSCYTT